MTTSKKTYNSNKKRWYKKFVKWFWIVFAIIILTPFIMIFLASVGVFGPMPSHENITKPTSNYATEVISIDGKNLGTYFVQNRVEASYDDISKHAIDALIATEDNRFFVHSGVDFIRSFSIIFYNLIGKRQGASTITQQLALNLFSYRERDTFKRIIQKVQELIIAFRLERAFTKVEIISMYLNTVDFGLNCFGINAAAKTYFNTTAKDLTLEQATVLIGLLKGTHYYSPVYNEERAKKRRNFVLYRMAEEGFISKQIYKETIKKDIELKLKVASHNRGLAPHFRSVLVQKVKEIIRSNNLRNADGEYYDIYKDGLKIYTTLHSVLQKYAEEAQQEYLPELQKQYLKDWKGSNQFIGIDSVSVLRKIIRTTERYRQMKSEGIDYQDIEKSFKTLKKMKIFTWQGERDTLLTPLDSLKYYRSIVRNAILSIDPKTGYVKAWVGGVDFSTFKYDQVIRGARQVGSTAKPFTYAVAVQRGFEPCTMVQNESVTIDDWSPRSEGAIEGEITIKNALAHSQNFVTAYLMKELGPVSVAKFIRQCGVTSDIPEVPSICLGSFDASLFEMVMAYTPFINKGILTEPIYLLRIENKNGKILYENNLNKTTLMEEHNAYSMLNMLRKVVDSGTAVRLRYKYDIRAPMLGKTGTTQKNSDGWFIGSTPSLLTGVWTGFEDRRMRFRTTRIGQGANAALPVFALYMKKIYEDISLGYSEEEQFNAPEDYIEYQLDCPPDAYYYKKFSKQDTVEVEQ